jgi:hypothetical protein
MNVLIWLTSVVFIMVFALNYNNSMSFFIFAQTAPADGGVKEVIIKDWLQFYVSNIVTKSGTTQKEVTINYIIKNMDDSPKAFGGYMTGKTILKDQDGTSFKPEISKANSISPFMVDTTSISKIPIPKHDIVSGKDIFKIPLSSTPTLFSYTQSEIPIPPPPKVNVDLTLVASPPEEPIKSDWTLGSNVGYTANIDSLKLTIDSERFSQDNLYYILGATIENIGNNLMHVSSSSLNIQNQNGEFLEIYPNHNEFTFKDEYLDPGQLVSGNIVYSNNPSSSAHKMIIWTPTFLDSTNSGKLLLSP